MLGPGREEMGEGLLPGAPAPPESARHGHGGDARRSGRGREGSAAPGQGGPPCSARLLRPAPPAEPRTALAAAAGTGAAGRAGPGRSVPAVGEGISACIRACPALAPQTLRPLWDGENLIT